MKIVREGDTLTYHVTTREAMTALTLVGANHSKSLCSVVSALALADGDEMLAYTMEGVERNADLLARVGKTTEDLREIGRRLFNKALTHAEPIEGAMRTPDGVTFSVGIEQSVALAQDIDIATEPIRGVMTEPDLMATYSLISAVFHWTDDELMALTEPTSEEERAFKLASLRLARKEHEQAMAEMLRLQFQGGTPEEQAA